MTTPVQQDYLFLQPLIIQRLLATVPGGQVVPIDGAERMAQAFEQDLRPMTVWVLWAGDRMDRSNAGPGALTYQAWLVLLAMRNVAPAQDARTSSAGTWLAWLHKAMAGWQPTGVPGSAKFTRIQGPKPDYKAGSVLYPLQFEIPIHL